MKTNRKINSAIKGTAIIMAGLLFTTGLFAQKSQMKNVPESLLKSTDQILAAFINLNESYSFAEETVELEDWMINLDKWAKSVDTASYIKAKKESGFDQKLIMEDWMLKADWLKKEEKNFDQELELEDWMMSPFNK